MYTFAYQTRMEADRIYRALNARYRKSISGSHSQQPLFAFSNTHLTTPSPSILTIHSILNAIYISNTCHHKTALRITHISFYETDFAPAPVDLKKKNILLAKKKKENSAKASASKFILLITCRT